MTSQEEQWLDNLLADPPSVRDNGFTDQTLHAIKRYKQRRMMVFAGAWSLAFLLVLFVSPWTSLQSWVGVLESSNFSIVAQIKAQIAQSSADQWAALLSDNWAFIFAFLAITLVSLKNVFLSDV